MSTLSTRCRIRALKEILGGAEVCWHPVVEPGTILTGRYTSVATLQTF
ncbi:MAG: hypothetical protein VX749_03000 [Pseudomonadota bacterium]|nr:hypothetical protein [Pseudomonadota bacterium]